MKKTFKLKIEANKIKEYNVSKYKFKKIKNLFDSLFLDFDFYYKNTINVNLNHISNQRFFMSVSMPAYSIYFDVAINGEEFIIKNYSDNSYKLKKEIIKIPELSKENLISLLNEIDYNNVFNIIKDNQLTLDLFINNKKFYFQTIEMCLI